MPAKPAFVNTIVTTDLQRKIAKSYGASVYEVLTGFKYIADVMRRLESTGESFLLGAEESYGFLVETEVHDKDAVSAAMMATEMALYHRSEGRTVLDALHRLYERYGYYRELLLSRGFGGQEGLEKMKKLMTALRSDPPKSFGPGRVITMKDFQTGVTTRIDASGKRSTATDIDLPSSDVLQFYLDEGSIVTVRPSGTEPKIKFYASCCSAPGTPLASAEKEVGERIAAIEGAIDRIMAG